MDAARSWLRARPVATFYGLSLALSWGYWLGLLVQGAQVGPGSGATHFPGLLGPVVAALLVCGLESGAAGITTFARRLLRWPAPPWICLGLALSPVLLGVVGLAVQQALGHPWPGLEDFSHFPGLPGVHSLLAIGLLVGLINGLGEEGGWRGFALERLIPSLGRLRATLAVAAMWAFWHAPLFWLNTSMKAMLGPVLVGWALSLLTGAFVLAQVYLRSKGSVLPVAIWHASYNLLVATPAGAGLAAAVCGALVMAWGLGVALHWWHAERHRDA